MRFIAVSAPSIAVILLLLCFNISVAQEQPHDESRSSDGAGPPPAEELKTLQSKGPGLEPLDPALESKRDAIDEALAPLDNKQKFDWLRRKRNEIQLTMLR
jgi:hypothetical protein